tara:strand:- start:1390 stop:1647 length:258 start_codon:yes stop_codon:yes gene_type:complete
LETKKRITETYPELFGESIGNKPTTRNESFALKWNWYNSIFALSGGDILKFNEVTKLKLHKCLMHLAFEKDKYELEQQILKSHRK